ncbi:MAG: hypothetical protein QGG40_15110, partial [Myxococcota bacterium]|nr:hypothetical protein [Myxococcota bacterium]
MRVPVSLLRDLVDVPQDLEHLAEVLNARVSEIERVERFPGPGELEGLSIVAGEGQTRLVDAKGEP